MQFLGEHYFSQDLNGDDMAYLAEGPLQEANGEYSYFELDTSAFAGNRARLCMVELSDFNWVPRMARYFEQMKTVSLPDEDGGWVEQPREDYEVPALTLASLPGFGGGGVCIPHVLVGIRAETENSAFATGFVRCIYNTEVQRYYLHQNNGGLPVVTALLGELENNARAAGIVYMDWVDDTSESRELAYPEGAHVSEVLTGVRQAYIPDVLLEQSLYNNVL